VRSGRPRIAGTGIIVEDVAIALNAHQQTIEGIAEWYGLSKSQVHAALAYYYEYQTEIDENIRRRKQEAETLKERLGDGRDSLLPR